MAAYCVNAPETIAAFLAVNGLGAIWSSCSPDFGINAVNDRFSQLQPKVLFAHSSYTYRGKRYDISAKVDALQKPWATVIPSTYVAIRLLTNLTKIYISFIKSLCHSLIRYGYCFHQVRLENPKRSFIAQSNDFRTPKALAIHQNVCEGDRYFWYSTTGWMM